MSMIGRNVLTLNTATMKAALALYLNSQRACSAPLLTVESVEPKDKYAGLFEVQVSTPEPSQ